MVVRATRRASVRVGAVGVVSARAYRGVLAEVSEDADGLTDISNIRVSTTVGNLGFHLARPGATNDRHGPGAFLRHERGTRRQPVGLTAATNWTT